MNPFSPNTLSMQSLENISNKDGVLQRFHPALKISLTLIYTICVVSCQPHQILILTPFAILLCILHIMAGIPVKLLWKRMLIALPFVFFVGLWNCFINTSPVIIAGIHTTSGILSMVSLIFRTCLTVGCLLILVGVTPIRDLPNGMRQMHIPMEFVIIFELICRYLGLIID